MSGTTIGAALRENPYVIELAALLEEQGRTEAAREFRSLTEHVSGMERQLEAAAGEIAAMRRELAELRDFHGEPLHNTARQGVETAHRETRRLQDRLGAVRSKIIRAARDGVAAVKQKGAVALDGVVSFLGLRKELENIHRDSHQKAARSERAIARVKGISRQYHEVGAAVRNFGRAATGKETRDDAKPAGRLMKAAAAPFQALKRLHDGMAKGTRSALDTLDRLEQAARRPSLLGQVQSLKETAALERDVAEEKTTIEPSL